MTGPGPPAREASYAQDLRRQAQQKEGAEANVERCPADSVSLTLPNYIARRPVDFPRLQGQSYHEGRAPAGRRGRRACTLSCLAVPPAGVSTH